MAAENLGIYPFSAPAIVALLLLCLETLYIYRKLPETRKSNKREQKQDHCSQRKISDAPEDQRRLMNLWRLKIIHCLHLFLFSGMEFTLVFLTFDVLDYSNMQQGRLLAYMGILSALLQGGYVRRIVQKLGEKALVLQGMVACTAGLLSLSMMVSSAHSVRWLYAGVSCLALTSATVVNCLTSMASLQCYDEDTQHPLLAKGRALGEFRSSGQLGRALGPVSACGLYWLAGPERCYATGAAIMAMITLLTAAKAPSTNKHKTE